MRAAVLAVGAALTLVGPACAHDGVTHATPDEAAAHAAASTAPTPEIPFPVRVTPVFDLVDTAGARVTQADFAGRPMAIFFGYATCEAICSVVLPRLGKALDRLGETDLAPLVITVDPEHDTPEAMRAALERWSPRLIGLTGSAEALAAARAAFQVEATEVARGPDGAAIFAHGSFVYLVGRDGLVKTVLPPILSPERMAEIIARYL